MGNSTGGVVEASVAEIAVSSPILVGFRRV